MSRAPWLFLGCLLAAAPPAHAQVVRSAEHVVREVVTDPTSYAPAALLYTSERLDWQSSRPLFQLGFVEDNPRFTVTGLPHDVPVSNGRADRRILADAVMALPEMFAYNAASRIGERVLIAWWPTHPRLIHVLGWVERIALSAYVSYRLAAGHFRQWRRNQQLWEAEQ